MRSMVEKDFPLCARATDGPLHHRFAAVPLPQWGRIFIKETLAAFP
jgi:hypothetical protein